MNNIFIKKFGLRLARRAAFCLLLLALVACAQARKTEADAAVKTVANPKRAEFPRLKELPPVWQKLALRLQKAGVGGADVENLLFQLPPTPTQSPMGRKIRELYNRAFFPGSKKAATPWPYYKGVVTQANAALCREYIRAHQAAFDSAREKYGVPPDVGAALLFVETRLGKVLGDVPENAFYTLASMAVTDQPRDIPDWLPKLDGYQKRLGWLDETMRKRSDWAFNETAALLRHMVKDGVPPERLPGSIYGAVGLCQFMPSNISAYGADGDGDGRVDLFTPPDAIASLAKYLAKHGWRSGLSPAAQHKALMTYNHSAVYANTILALSELIRDPSLAADKIKPVGERRSGKK